MPMPTWWRFGKSANRRGDVTAAQIGRRAKSKTSTRGVALVGCLSFQVSQLLRNAPAAFQLDRASVGQPEASPTAIRQLYAQSLLEFGQTADDRRWRGAEVVRRRV